jgi:hypothetical protein
VPSDGKDGLNGMDAEVDYGRVIAEVVKLVPPGKDGANGKDADAVDYARVVADVAKMFAPPKDGVDGRDGKDADPAAIMQMVKDAVSLVPKAMDGKPGEDGRDGRDGEPGRDAFAIEILDGIDPERKYQRGSFAAHNGGFWVARSATEGMKGWDCIANALADFDFEQADDLRTFNFTWKYANGKQVVKSAKIPVTIHRGIYRDDQVYERGDQTTRDGSQWTLMTDVQHDKPGVEGSGWQLSSKRGRDGRDGLRGDTGARGAEGRAGKDLTQIGPDGRKW